MEIPYEPDSPWSGVVTLKIKPWEERMKLVNEMTDKKTDTIGMFAKLAKEGVSKVELVHEESGQEIKSFEELSCYAEGFKLITELGRYVIKGVPLAQSSEEKSEPK